MTEKKNVTWKKAFLASPGPESIKDSIMLAFKGLCMGTADIIPGVSGGTIALITGIYQNLLQAIRSANTVMVSKLVTFDLKGALSEVHIRFLISLFIGIAIAVISLARLMNYLLHNQPVLTWSLFFGLIAASILVVGKKVRNRMGSPALSFLAGTAAAWIIVGLIPVSTPETPGFIFFSGFVAICAMILPGLSGAFLLLILGKYEFITGALKNPFLFTNITTIAVFCTGCLCGLLGFSRILNFLLSRWYNLTLAFLTGLMAGSMRKIWPWKEALEAKMIRDKLPVISDQNILPKEINTEFIFAIILMIVGFIVVMFLERLSAKK